MTAKRGGSCLEHSQLFSDREYKVNRGRATNGSKKKNKARTKRS